MQSSPCPVVARAAPSAANALRVLFRQGFGESCAVSRQEQHLLEEFAAQRGSELVWLSLPHEQAMLDAVRSGQADLALGVEPQFDAQGMIRHHCIEKSMPTADAEDGICHTLPWAETRERLVERANGAAAIGQLEDLRARQVAVRRESPAWSRLQALALRFPGLGIVEVSSDISDKQLMQRTLTGRYDVAVADSLSLAHHLPSVSGLRAGLSLTKPTVRTWAVSERAKVLHAALNEFIQTRHLAMQQDVAALNDFDAIVERSILRLITVVSPAHYRLQEGMQQGFEYELLQGFAARHALQLEVILAASEQEMLDLLSQGKGDVLAASLPASYIESLPDARATRHYLHATPLLIGRRSDAQGIVDPSDLAGRRITLASESPWHGHLQALQSRGFDFDVQRAEKGQSVLNVMSMVEKGMYDLTVVGSHQLSSHLARQRDLEGKFSLDEPLPLAWATRADSRLLRVELNAYLQDVYRDAAYNILHQRYFPIAAPTALDERAADNILFSQWDDLVARYSWQYGFDWQLILAMMFQESRFDPQALSYAGALGLMQLTPDTQDFLRVQDPTDPKQSIQGGIEYLSYLRGQFEDELMPQERTWFSLAAYNAGLNRVKQARRMAESMGLDSNVWFDNVERAMLSLAQPFEQDGEMVRHCRCGQTVVYVREIKTRYRNYLRYLRDQKPSFAWRQQ